MARRSLPESLELLLDTMCNTFGGVMFIAISMVITLMLSQQKLTPEKQREEEMRRLFRGPGDLGPEFAVDLLGGVGE